MMSTNQLKGLAILLSFFMCITACQQRQKGKTASSENPDDAEIYRTVLNHCIKADSGIRLSEGKIEFEEGPVKKLLLLDSTLVVPEEKIEIFESMVHDSMLLKKFVLQNQEKAIISVNWSRQVQLRKFPRQTFDKFLKLNTGNGFMELYKKFPGISGVLEFSTVSYNSLQNQAIVELCYYKSPEESFAIFYLLKKTGTQWDVVDKRVDC